MECCLFLFFLNCFRGSMNIPFHCRSMTLIDLNISKICFWLLMSSFSAASNSCCAICCCTSWTHYVGSDVIMDQSNEISAFIRRKRNGKANYFCVKCWSCFFFCKHISIVSRVLCFVVVCLNVCMVRDLNTQTHVCDYVLPVCQVKPQHQTPCLK